MILRVWRVERPALHDPSYRSFFRKWRPVGLTLPEFDQVRKRGDGIVAFGRTGLLLTYMPTGGQCPEAGGLLAWSQAKRHHAPLGAQAVLTGRKTSDWTGEAVDLTILVCSQTLHDLAAWVLAGPLTPWRVHRYLRGARPWVRLAHLLAVDHTDPRLEVALAHHRDVMGDIAVRGGIPSSVGWSLLVSQISRLL